MPLSIIINDITKVECDAIVNPSNNSLYGSGPSVDGDIHRLGGYELERDCILLGGCETGKAKITKAYNLPCKYIIHTVPPVWYGGIFHEDEFLASCYRESLALCKKFKLRSVAFPIMASGSNRYPKENAFRIAINEIKSFLDSNELLIYLVVYDPLAIVLGQKLKSEVSDYIKTHAQKRSPEPQCVTPDSKDFDKKLAAHLSNADVPFHEKLWDFIDKKGLTNPECYKRANLDKKHFSKIQSGKVKPKKSTVLALAAALRLTLEETNELLKSAGYALSHNDKTDLIIEYFIMNKQYDIYDINFTLVDFGLPPLGSY